MSRTDVLKMARYQGDIVCQSYLHFPGGWGISADRHIGECFFRSADDRTQNGFIVFFSHYDMGKRQVWFNNRFFHEFAIAYIHRIIFKAEIPLSRAGQ